MANNSSKTTAQDGLIYHISDHSDEDSSDSSDSHDISHHSDGKNDDGKDDGKNSWTTKTKIKKVKRKNPSSTDSPQNTKEKRQKGDEAINDSSDPQQSSDIHQPQPNQTHANPKHHLILFITGKTSNIAKQAFNNPIKFKNDLVSQIGKYDAAKIKDNHIIITCNNTKQRAETINVQQIMNIEVTVSEPRSSAQILNG